MIMVIKRTKLDKQLPVTRAWWKNQLNLMFFLERSFNDFSYPEVIVQNERHVKSGH